MIPNYSFPQATIAQVLEATNNPVLDRLHAVVVGPAYVHADVASGNLAWDPYEENSSIPYLMADGRNPSGGEVDQPAVKLLAQSLLLQLATWGSVTATPAVNQFIVYPASPTGDLLQYNDPAGFLDTKDPSVVEAFDKGRAPTLGDIYRITSDLATIDRRVLALVGQDIVGSAGSYGYSGAQPWVNSGEDESITLLSSNVPINPAFSAVGPELLLAARQKGAVALEGGLRLLLAVHCTAAGNATTATFSATLNGLATPIANALSGALTNFTFLTTSIIGVNRTAWAEGDRFTVAMDFANAGDLFALTDNVDTGDLTYTDSIRRVGSTLVLEVLDVKAADITVRISDTTGLAAVKTVTITGAQAVEIPYDGTEIFVDLPAELVAEAHVGQRYTALITPATRSSTVFDKVRLSAPVGMEGATDGVLVVGLVPFSGTIPAEEPIKGNINFVVGPDAVEVAAIQQRVSGYPSALDSVKTAVDGSGTVAVSWRATVPVGTTEGLFPVDDTQDIIDALGSDALASELGFGLSKALSGSQGKRIYGLNTGGTSRAAFQAAILKLESSNYIYAIAVLTSDEDIMRDFSQHARLSSLKEIKRFRRIYVGTDSPGEYAIMDQREDGTPYLATITAGDNGNNLVTFTEDDVNLDPRIISRGDKLYLPGTDETFIIDRVSGSDTLVLAAGPVNPVAETTARVIAADTPENVARFVYGRSQRIGTNVEERRRINNVWTDNGIYDVGIGTSPIIPNRFGAAEIAGLRTAIQPQQSLTRTEVSYITDAPSMFTRFNSEVLNTMAANGVWIITQNSPDAIPHIRHQITAEVSSGSLFYEDSAGVNIDSICFAIDDIVDPLIGKRNATNRTVVEIKNLLLNLLNDLTESAYDSVIGPQIVDFFNAAGDVGTLDVAIDPVLKDTINVGVVLEIPLPLNNIRVTVLARTIRLDGGTVVNALTVTVLPAAA
jgi:hypothetical protein